MLYEASKQIQLAILDYNSHLSRDKAKNKQGIKTHDSESRGQEEAEIIRETKIKRPLSELLTKKTAKKIYHFVITDLIHS